jgi:inhibitor of cysteine peptidase
MAEVLIGLAEAGGTVTAAPGDSIVVRLDETPTSGYRWGVETFDPAVLEPAGDEFTPAADSALGGGGTHEFRFRVVGAGEAVLRLMRRRSWEAYSPEADAYEVTIRVDG